jgi:hypothetical protein
MFEVEGIHYMVSFIPENKYGRIENADINELLAEFTTGTRTEEPTIENARMFLRSYLESCPTP